MCTVNIFMSVSKLESANHHCSTIIIIIYITLWSHTSVCHRPLVVLTFELNHVRVHLNVESKISNMSRMISVTRISVRDCRYSSVLCEKLMHVIVGIAKKKKKMVSVGVKILPHACGYETSSRWSMFRRDQSVYNVRDITLENVLFIL